MGFSRPFFACLIIEFNNEKRNIISEKEEYGRLLNKLKDKT